MPNTLDFRALAQELIKIVEEHCNPDEYALCDVVDTLNRARIALATPPPEPTVDGEVAELAALIRQCALAWEPDARLLGNMTAAQLARAAELLERTATPPPVGGPMVLTKPQLEKLNEVLHSHQDEGPPYPEGWASPELEDLRQIIDRWSTAPAPAVVPVGDATTPPRPQPTGGRQIGPFF